MTDRFLPVDAALLSVAVALLALALWLTRREASATWDPAVFFAACLGALFGRDLPLTGGAADEDAQPDDDHAPSALLAPELTWRDVGDWSEGTRAAVTRRLADVKLVWLEPPVVAIEGLAPRVLTEAEVAPLFTRPEERLVLAASAEAQRALQLLHDDAGLRDRVRAVLLVAPRLDPAWLAANFTHTAFDVEVAREVPFLTLRTPPDADAQRLPQPPPPPSELVTVAVVDLGVLPAEHLGDARVGRALAALLAALA